MPAALWDCCVTDGTDSAVLEMRFQDLRNEPVKG